MTISGATTVALSLPPWAREERESLRDAVFPRIQDMAEGISAPTDVVDLQDDPSAPGAAPLGMSLDVIDAAHVTVAVIDGRYGEFDDPLLSPVGSAWGIANRSAGAGGGGGGGVDDDNFVIGSPVSPASRAARPAARLAEQVARLASSTRPWLRSLAHRSRLDIEVTHALSRARSGSCPLVIVYVKAGVDESLVDKRVPNFSDAAPRGSESDDQSAADGGDKGTSESLSSISTDSDDDEKAAGKRAEPESAAAKRKLASLLDAVRATPRTLVREYTSVQHLADMFLDDVAAAAGLAPVADEEEDMGFGGGNMNATGATNTSSNTASPNRAGPLHNQHHQSPWGAMSPAVRAHALMNTPSPPSRLGTVPFLGARTNNMSPGSPYASGEGPFGRDATVGHAGAYDPRARREALSRAASAVRRRRPNSALSSDTAAAAAATQRHADALASLADVYVGRKSDFAAIDAVVFGNGGGDGGNGSSSSSPQPMPQAQSQSPSQSQSPGGAGGGIRRRRSGGVGSGGQQQQQQQHALLVTGDPGVGKSALVAAWASTRSRKPKRAPVFGEQPRRINVVPFIDTACNDGTTLTDALREIMLRLKAMYKIRVAVPIDRASVYTEFPAFAARAARVSGVTQVIVIDGLDVLAGSDESLWGSAPPPAQVWAPREQLASAGVRIIATATAAETAFSACFAPSTGNNTKNNNRKSTGFVGDLASFGWKHRRVAPLGAETVVKLSEYFCGAGTPAARAVSHSAFASNPLALTMAAAAINAAGSLEPVQSDEVPGSLEQWTISQASGLLNLPSVVSLSLSVCERLAGKRHVRSLLGALLGSAGPLTAMELIDASCAPRAVLATVLGVMRPALLLDDKQSGGVSVRRGLVGQCLGDLLWGGADGGVASARSEWGTAMADIMSERTIGRRCAELPYLLHAAAAALGDDGERDDGDDQEPASAAACVIHPPFVHEMCRAGHAHRIAMWWRGDVTALGEALASAVVEFATDVVDRQLAYDGSLAGASSMGGDVGGTVQRAVTPPHGTRGPGSYSDESRGLVRSLGSVVALLSELGGGGAQHTLDAARVALPLTERVFGTSSPEAAGLHRLAGIACIGLGDLDGAESEVRVSLASSDDGTLAAAEAVEAMTRLILARAVITNDDGEEEINTSADTREQLGRAISLLERTYADHTDASDPPGETPSPECTHPSLLPVLELWARSLVLAGDFPSALPVAQRLKRCAKSWYGTVSAQAVRGSLLTAVSWRGAGWGARAMAESIRALRAAIALRRRCPGQEGVGELDRYDAERRRLERAYRRRNKDETAAVKAAIAALESPDGDGTASIPEPEDEGEGEPDLLHLTQARTPHDPRHALAELLHAHTSVSRRRHRRSLTQARVTHSRTAEKERAAALEAEAAEKERSERRRKKASAREREKEREQREREKEEREREKEREERERERERKEKERERGLARARQPGGCGPVRCEVDPVATRLDARCDPAAALRRVAISWRPARSAEAAPVDMYRVEHLAASEKACRGTVVGVWAFEDAGAVDLGTVLTPGVHLHAGGAEHRPTSAQGAARPGSPGGRVLMSLTGGGGASGSPKRPQSSSAAMRPSKARGNGASGRGGKMMGQTAVLPGGTSIAGGNVATITDAGVVLGVDGHVKTTIENTRLAGAITITVAVKLLSVPGTNTSDPEDENRVINLVTVTDGSTTRSRIQINVSAGGAVQVHALRRGSAEPSWTEIWTLECPSVDWGRGMDALAEATQVDGPTAREALGELRARKPVTVTVTYQAGAEARLYVDGLAVDEVTPPENALDLPSRSDSVGDGAGDGDDGGSFETAGNRQARFFDPDVPQTVHFGRLAVLPGETSLPGHEQLLCGAAVLGCCLSPQTVAALVADGPRAALVDATTGTLVAIGAEVEGQRGPFLHAVGLWDFEGAVIDAEETRIGVSEHPLRELTGHWPETAPNPPLTKWHDEDGFGALALRVVRAGSLALPFPEGCALDPRSMTIVIDARIDEVAEGAMGSAPSPFASLDTGRASIGPNGVVTTSKNTNAAAANALVGWRLVMLRDGRGELVVRTQCPGAPSSSQEVMWRTGAPIAIGRRMHLVLSFDVHRGRAALYVDGELTAVRKLSKAEFAVAHAARIAAAAASTASDGAAASSSSSGSLAAASTSPGSSPTRGLVRATSSLNLAFPGIGAGAAFYLGSDGPSAARSAAVTFFQAGLFDSPVSPANARALREEGLSAPLLWGQEHHEYIIDTRAAAAVANGEATGRSVTSLAPDVPFGPGLHYFSVQAHNAKGWSAPARVVLPLLHRPPSAPLGPGTTAGTVASAKHAATLVAASVASLASAVSASPGSKGAVVASLSLSAKSGGGVGGSVGASSPSGNVGEVTDVGVESISLSWEPPADAGSAPEGLDYVVRAYVSPGVPSAHNTAPVVTETTSECRVTLRGLVSNTRYEIHVTARTVAGGESREYLEATALTLPPEPPRPSLTVRRDVLGRLHVRCALPSYAPVEAAPGTPISRHRAVYDSVELRWATLPQDFESGDYESRVFPVPREARAGGGSVSSRESSSTNAPGHVRRRSVSVDTTAEAEDPEYVSFDLAVNDGRPRPHPDVWFSLVVANESGESDPVPPKRASLVQEIVIFADGPDPRFITAPFGITDVACAAGGVVAITADGRLARYTPSAKPSLGSMTIVGDAAVVSSAPGGGPTRKGAVFVGGAFPNQQGYQGGAVGGPDPGSHRASQQHGASAPSTNAAKVAKPAGVGTRGPTDPGLRLLDTLSRSLAANGDTPSHIAGCGGTVLCASASGALYAASARSKASKRVASIVPGTGFAAGPTHCVAITTSGGDNKKSSKRDADCLSWGHITESTLGRSLLAPAHSADRRTLGPADEPVGGYDPRPAPVNAMRGKDCVGVACGDSHTAVVTSKGEVLTWGNGKHGQLGVTLASGLPLPTTSFPTPVHGLPRIAAVAAGRQFTVALSAVGTVYAWGRNDRGQCGILGARRYPVPVRVEGLPESVVQIAAGAAHVVALTRAGDVYMWGEGIALPTDTAYSHGNVGGADVSETASRGARRESLQSATGSEDSAVSRSRPRGPSSVVASRRTVVRPTPHLVDLAGVRIVRVGAGWDGTVALLTAHALTGAGFVPKCLVADSDAGAAGIDWSGSDTVEAGAGKKNNDDGKGVGSAASAASSSSSTTPVTSSASTSLSSLAGRADVDDERLAAQLRSIAARREAAMSPTPGVAAERSGTVLEGAALVGGCLTVTAEVAHTAAGSGSSRNYCDIDLGTAQRVDCLEFTSFDGALGFCVATTVSGIPRASRDSDAGDGDDASIGWDLTVVVPPSDRPPALLGSVAVGNLPQRIAMQVLAQQDGHAGSSSTSSSTSPAFSLSVPDHPSRSRSDTGTLSQLTGPDGGTGGSSSPLGVSRGRGRRGSAMVHTPLRHTRPVPFTVPLRAVARTIRIMPIMQSLTMASEQSLAGGRLPSFAARVVAVDGRRGVAEMLRPPAFVSTSVPSAVPAIAIRRASSTSHAGGSGGAAVVVAWSPPVVLGDRESLARNRSAQRDRGADVGDGVADSESVHVTPPLRAGAPVMAYSLQLRPQYGRWREVQRCSAQTHCALVHVGLVTVVSSQAPMGFPKYPNGAKETNTAAGGGSILAQNAGNGVSGNGGGDESGSRFDLRVVPIGRFGPGPSRTISVDTAGQEYATPVSLDAERSEITAGVAACEAELSLVDPTVKRAAEEAMRKTGAAAVANAKTNTTSSAIERDGDGGKKEERARLAALAEDAAEADVSSSNPLLRAMGLVQRLEALRERRAWVDAHAGAVHDTIARDRGLLFAGVHGATVAADGESGVVVSWTDLARHESQIGRRRDGVPSRLTATGFRVVEVTRGGAEKVVAECTRSTRVSLPRSVADREVRISALCWLGSSEPVTVHVPRSG